MSTNKPAPRPETIATVIVVGVVIASHLAFVLLDGRLPADLNEAHKQIPELARGLSEQGDWGAVLLHAVLEPAGWYQLAMLLPGALGIPPLLAFFAINLLSLCAVLGGVAMVSRRTLGPAGGLLAVSLAASCQGLTTQARLAWVHFPELALLMVILMVLSRDRALRRTSSAVVIGISALLILSLRPSGAIWLLTLAPSIGLALWQGLKRPGGGRRAVLVGWGVLIGALPVLRAIEQYTASKLEMLGQYEHLMTASSLLQLTLQQLGLPLTGLGLLGVTYLLFVHPRKWSSLLVTLYAWLLLPFALYFVFQAGLDNFPVMTVAFALLAAAGLVRIEPRLAWVQAGLAMLIVAGAWLPDGMTPHMIPKPVLPLLRHVEEGVENYDRVFDDLPGEEIISLVHEACGARTVEAPCHVTVDHSLFQPFAEEPGRFELFLAGERSLRLTRADELYLGTREDIPHVLASYVCPQHEDIWYTKHPEIARHMELLESSATLDIVHSRMVAGGCSFELFTVTPL